MSVFPPSHKTLSRRNADVGDRATARQCWLSLDQRSRRFGLKFTRQGSSTLSTVHSFDELPTGVAGRRQVGVACNCRHGRLILSGNYKMAEEDITAKRSRYAFGVAQLVCGLRDAYLGAISVTSCLFSFADCDSLTATFETSEYVIQKLSSKPKVKRIHVRLKLSISRQVGTSSQRQAYQVVEEC